MAMLSAGDRMRSEQSHGRMPAFVLDSNNLECYRPWLKRVREWARSKGGRVMELHLIGEEVPVAELTAEALANGGLNVVGYPADESVGAEGGRRRQMRNPETFLADTRTGKQN